MATSKVAKVTTKASKTNPPTLNIVIPAMALEKINLHVEGMSPLLVHRWSDKAKKMILDKQMKQPSAGREAKNPEMDFFESLYWLDGMPKQPTMAMLKTARFGFPAIAFKSAAVEAVTQLAGVTKVFSRQAFHIQAQMVVIKGVPEMHEEMVRVGVGTADIRYRGVFPQWSTVLPIQYNSSVISAAQIANLFNIGGFGCGVGEWRPSKDGSYGRFTVVGV